MTHSFFNVAPVFVLGVFLSGCEASRPDQEPIREALFWTDAQITSRPAPDPDAILVRVVDGDSTVLMSNEGFTHGRRTTTHASHHAVFLTLPRDIAEGRTYRASREDGTMQYDGFAGYNFWYMDPLEPAWAKVEIKSMSADTVTAHVQTKLTAVCGAQETAVTGRPRMPIARDRTIVFHRTNKPEAANRSRSPCPASGTSQ